MLLDAMRKPDGTYRTYDEMVAEKHPAAVLRQVDRLHVHRPATRTARARPFSVYMYGVFMAEVDGGHQDRQDHGGQDTR